MIDDRPPAVRGGGAFSALARDGLTHVELTWIEKKLEHWIASAASPRIAS